MPMPHRTYQQVIKRRLVGKEGSERIRELREILGELPGYKNGPYADLRKWVENELDATRTRKRTSVRRTSVPRVAKGFSGLLAKLSLASSTLEKSRKRR